MTKIELFEEALCCSTGVCGPSVDQDLLRITADFEMIKRAEGFEAERYNLSSNPQQFIVNKRVSELLNTVGMEALPITISNGAVVKTGAYPTHAELSEYTGLKFDEADETVRTIADETVRTKG